MSAYVPVNWQDGVSPVNAANLNRMEDRIELLDAVPKVPTPLVEGNWLKVQGGALVWAPAPAGGGGGGLDWEGAYAPAIPYVKGDVVTYGGVVYGAVNDSTGQTPPVAQPIQQTLVPISLVTVLPSSPIDGQEVVFTDSLVAPTFTWHLRYVAAKASNKWVFVGGSPAFAEVVTAETRASTAYGDLATIGPSVTIPVAGDYLVTISFAAVYVSGGGTFNSSMMSFAIGATAASDADAATGTHNNTVNTRAGSTRVSRKTGLAAGTALVAKYRGGEANTFSYSDRRLLVVPIAVGG